MRQPTDTLTMVYKMLTKISLRLRLNVVSIVALICFLCSSTAFAVPTIKDQWHFFCGPNEVSSKKLAKARGKTSIGGLKGGIAQLNYACLLEIHEMSVYREKLNKWSDAGGTGAQPQLDNRGSTQALARAVSTLSSYYKSPKKNPNALYYYALALAVKGDVMTVNIFDEYMTNFKKDKKIGDAYLALGDHYFERRDLPKAFREYNKALKLGRPIVKAYTRYKMAWINFATAVEQKNTAKQGKIIEDLVNQKGRLDRSKNKLEKRLGAMIASDVSDLLAQQGNLAEAKRILKAMNADDVYATVLEKMANVKISNNDIEGAYQLFSLALKEAPERRESLLIATSMVQIAAQKNDVKRLTGMLKYMVNNFTQDESPWRKAQKDNKAALTKANTQIETMVIDYAAAIDNQGRQSNDNNMLNAARSLYEVFIKSFKKSKRLREVKTQYGTLLYLQKSYVASARVLHEVLSENSRDKSAKELAALMVTAAQYAVDADKTQYTPVDPSTPKDEKPRPIPATKKVFADSLDMFAKLNPSDPNAPAMIYTSAAIYYDFGHFPEGIKRLEAYIVKYPANDFAKQAAVKVLNYQLKQNDKKGLKKSIEQFSMNAAIGDAAEVKPLLLKAKEKLKKSKKDEGSEASESNEETKESEASEKDSSDGEKKSSKSKSSKKKAADDEKPDGASDDGTSEESGNGSETSSDES